MNTHSSMTPGAAPCRRQRLQTAAAGLGASLLLGACSTTMTGMGGGDLIEAGKKTDEPVLISWISDSGA